MKMNLKLIVMNGIQTDDGIFDIFDNEEVDMNDDSSCDERDMLDAQDFDVTTIDTREGL